MFSNMGAEALRAVKTEEGRNAFILKNEKFILGCASHFTKRFITKSDDEWSIALIAFSNACDTYDAEKGNFQSYARLLIERRLTDYIRSQARFSGEQTMEPFVFEGNVDEDSDNAGYQLHIAKATSTSDENPIRDEILALNDLLKNYGISFMELTTCSPKAAKTKTACSRAIAFLEENPDIMEKMRTTRLFPIKKITENTKVPQKILERHRKYIITAAEILCNDFPLLQEYIK
jgi:RNA polymerase sigma factor